MNENEIKALYMDAYANMLTANWLMESTWREAREHARQDLRTVGFSVLSIHRMERIVCDELGKEWMPED